MPFSVIVEAEIVPYWDARVLNILSLLVAINEVDRGPSNRSATAVDSGVNLERADSIPLWSIAIIGIPRLAGCSVFVVIHKEGL